MSASLPQGARLWFGVFGAPAVWVVQFVGGYTLGAADCGGAGLDIPFDALTAAFTAVAACVAVAAGLTALGVFRETRDVGDEPPGSRVHFLSIVGMTIAPLFVAIILMSGLGAIVLESCHQS
ncbi:MAG TPA: hypothetical protein VGF25_17835 [Thermoleophilaceae bacterium]|jgi:hypothetical protein